MKHAGPRIYVPLTNTLRRELAKTNEVLSQDKATFNDKDDLLRVVTQLEDLTKAALASLSTGSFRQPRNIGARFDMGPFSVAWRAVTEAVEYLAEDASGLLGTKLSAYEDVNTQTALNHLKSVRAAIVGRIEQAALEDLHAIGAHSIEQLIKAATVLAEYVNGLSARDGSETGKG